MATPLKERISFAARILVCVVSLLIGVTLGLTSAAVGRVCTVLCLSGGAYYLMLQHQRKPIPSASDRRNQPADSAF